MKRVALSMLAVFAVWGILSLCGVSVFKGWGMLYVIVPSLVVAIWGKHRTIAKILFVTSIIFLILAQFVPYFFQAIFIGIILLILINVLKAKGKKSGKASN